MTPERLQGYVNPAIKLGREIHAMLTKIDPTSFTITEDPESSWNPCRIECSETDVKITFDCEKVTSWGSKNDTLGVIELNRSLWFDRDDRRRTSRYYKLKDGSFNLQKIVDNAIAAKKVVLKQKAAHEQRSDNLASAKESKNKVLAEIGLKETEMTQWNNTYLLGYDTNLVVTPHENGKISVHLNAGSLNAEQVKLLVTNIRIALDSYHEQNPVITEED